MQGEFRELYQSTPKGVFLYSGNIEKSAEK